MASIFSKILKKRFSVSVVLLVVFSGACTKNIKHSDDTGATPEIPQPIEPSKPDYIEDIKLTHEPFYIVQLGDNLYRLGIRFGVGYLKLAEWNYIHPPYQLIVGQKLKVFEVQWNSYENPAYEVSNPENKRRNTSQKMPIFSTDNKKLLKLHWHWPITGMVVRNFNQSDKKGIDISGYFDQLVKAAESGEVVYSGKGPKGVGSLLIIRHDEIYMSAYANTSELLVCEGQRVEKDQLIAKVGMSRSGKPLLHFEIRQYGNPVDPLYYLPVK